MATAQLHTIDDLMAMPDTDHYELIEGELFVVSPSGFDPSVIAARLVVALGSNSELLTTDHDKT